RVSRERDRGADIAIRKIFIPKMSDHAYALEAALEFAGVEAEVMPPTDDKAIRLGKKHVTGKECFPCAVTTGDMIKQASSPSFDAARSAFFMPSGTGPCRFGQYNVFQRLALERCGFNDVRIYSPVQSTQFYRDLGIIGKNFAERAWEGIVAIEVLTKLLHETRPVERDAGVSDSVYHNYLEQLRRTLRTPGKSIDNLLVEMRDAFVTIPKVQEEKPLIGIVGEIFVRSNAFSNEAIVRKVEELGGMVWLAPVEEWIYYVNFISLRKALRKMERSAIIQLFLKSLLQKRREHQFVRHFKGCLRTLEEPSTRTILAKASPYVHDSFEGEAVLSIGKTIDLIERGASGIINVMPFGCMPGTIVSGLLQRISRERGIPCISVAYDGTESTTTYLQLEAFIEQAKMKHRRHMSEGRPVMSQE
ncbi:MAG: acyl-CoA dehydratase activase, partial [Thermodesulfovibrionales bacterium]